MPTRFPLIPVLSLISFLALIPVFGFGFLLFGIVAPIRMPSDRTGPNRNPSGLPNYSGKNYRCKENRQDAYPPDSESFRLT